MKKCRNCESIIPFKGRNYQHVFCNNGCMYDYKRKQKELLFDARYQQWLNNEDLGIKKTREWIRLFVIKRDGDNCSVCGISEWNGKEISLWCDHIDGDATNNHPDNFRMVCPNCDSQSDTFGAKNTGKGRKSRGIAPYD